jgi:serine/threonine protein kinase
MMSQLLSGRYHLVRVLGVGGMGKTYIAEDTQRPGNPQCVVKQLKPLIDDQDKDAMAVARRLFVQEAEILEKIGNHPQIPRLLAYFEEGKEFYLVQEFIAGHPLSEELFPDKQWSEGQVIELLEEILRLLAFVHGQGVIHRDIKPDNLIRRDSDGRLVLIDFGAVKKIRSASNPLQEQVSQTVSIGTVGYMATEQASGKPRFSSDLYAVGMIAVQALTGMTPVQLMEDQQGEIVWQDQVQVSKSLATFISKMIRHYFVNRYQTAVEALTDLEKVKAGKFTDYNWKKTLLSDGFNFKKTLKIISVFVLLLAIILAGIFIVFQWQNYQNKVQLLSKIKEYKEKKDYQLCIDQAQQLINYPGFTEKVQPLITDCKNRLMIEEWGLEIQEGIFCDPSLVSIKIDQQKYCTKPTNWLAAGEYTYIREEDRLEPNWKL